MPASCEIRIQSEVNHDQSAVLDHAVQSDIGENRMTIHSPMSLIPDEKVMPGCVLDDEACHAIRDAWKNAIPIIVLLPTEFDDLVNQNPLAFIGRLADLKEAN